MTLFPASLREGNIVKYVTSWYSIWRESSYDYFVIIFYQWTLQNVFPAPVVQSVEDQGRLEPAFPGAAVIWVGTGPDNVAKIKE